MMKLCINCHALNSPDAIFCSECGMTLIKAPTGEEAVKPRKAHEAAHPEQARSSDTTDGYRPGPVVIAVAVGAGLLLFLLELIFEYPSYSQLLVIYMGIVLAGVAAFCVWVAAMDFGARLTDRSARRGRLREARRLGAYMTHTHAAGMELSKANLAGADAQRASLEGAILIEANLAQANLAEANLEGAVLSQARLAQANLIGANLSRANLAGADLSEANLSSASLRQANLLGANLERARLHAANLTEAHLPQANLQRAELEGANLEGANLQGARLAGADVDSTTVMPEGWEEVVASKPQDEPPAQRAAEVGSTVTVAEDTAPRSMMRLCLNCHTENPADAVLCSSCGMDLTRLSKPDEAKPADTTVPEALDGLQIAKFMWGWVLVAVGLAAMVCALAASMNPVITLAGLLYGVFGAWMILSVGIRLAGRDTRTRALMWAGGPLAGGAFAVAWLALASVAAVFMTILADSLDWGISPSLVLGGTFVLLFLSGLVVAPLVGAIIVLVEWLRGRSKKSDVLPASV
jgi:uncharacterized protein YjbI with pentapeptide repeats/ribosomal protein L40E